MNRQLKLVVKHHDAERVAEQYKDVIVHLQPRFDEEAHELGRFEASRADNLVIVLLQVCLHFVEDFGSFAHFCKRPEELEPVTNEIEPILPALDSLLVNVVATKHGIQHQVRVIEQVVQRRGELDYEIKEVLEDLDALGLIGDLAPLDKCLGGLTQFVQGEVRVAPLETLVLVDELEQFEHFSSGPDLLH